MYLHGTPNYCRQAAGEGNKYLLCIISNIPPAYGVLAGNTQTGSFGKLKNFSEDISHAVL